MSWGYRILVGLNALVLAVSLFVALSTLTALDARWLSWTLKAAYLAWPFPQIVGFWLAAKAKSQGDVGRAHEILFVQLVIFGGIPVALFFALLAAFPE